CVHFRAGSDCPPAVSEAAALLFDAERNGLLPEDRLGELEPFMAMAANTGHELRAYDDALDFVAGRRDAERRAARLEDPFPRGRGQRRKDYALDDFCKITNYEKLKPDLDLIAAWGPDLVIVDEAQRVKNWNTIAARALKQIDSPYAIVLTGTPLENKLEELIS